MGPPLIFRPIPDGSGPDAAQESAPGAVAGRPQAAVDRCRRAQRPQTERDPAAALAYHERALALAGDLGHPLDRAPRARQSRRMPYGHLAALA
ncbi:hypothetical protein Ari01nite_28190 [Paractinoplanes rishiriensis]|uniref:Uncharacterized protein n=1 Tax=Paractinoplanes rishiriensis TaxID=1050105 RepID=A0A919JXB2_9ACTN|nr:hypothetical protein Ari01nite_28190 [Actinoplanes rishiriensis]